MLAMLRTEEHNKKWYVLDKEFNTLSEVKEYVFTNFDDEFLKVVPELEPPFLSKKSIWQFWNNK